MKKHFVAALLFLGFVSSIVLFGGSSTHAAPVVGFNPENIIDDATFTNTGTMSVAQIQAFLESKVPSCDTYGRLPSPYGGRDINGDGTVQRWEWAQDRYGQTTFTCLRDYRAPDGRSAAQIIYDSAQYWRINPQVMLVLLQKEQSLVTDSWPLEMQYRSATGYGCPDTAACDSKYYGLVNQVDWANKMFRSIQNNSPGWYTPYVLGENYIQYNPQASCGGSVVNIRNRATQALYNYTPYQPNQGALDAGWGSAHCGAYGNRNFYLYFNEWFGGYLIHTSDNGNLYIRGAGNSYYQITTFAQLQGLGIGGLRTYTTTSQYLQNLQNAGQLSSAVQFNSIGDVYVLDSNRLHYLSADVYRAHGSPKVSNLAAGLDGGIIPRGQNMSTLITEHGVGALYSASAGERRYVSLDAFRSDGYSSQPVTWLSGVYLSSLPKGAPILGAGTIVQASDTGELAIINKDRVSKRRLEPSVLGSIAHTPFTDTSSVLNKIPTDAQPAVGVLVRDSRGNLFITDGTSKIHLSLLGFRSLNKPIENFQTVDDTYLRRLETVASSPTDFTFWVDDSPRVFRSESGEMVAVSNVSDFNYYGYSFDKTVRIRSHTARALFSNNDRQTLPPSTLYSPGLNGRTYYLDDTGNTSRTIPSGEIFNDYGFSWSDARTVTTSTHNYYSQGEALSNFVVTPDGNRWMVTKGKHYGLPTALSLVYKPSADYTPVSYATIAKSMRSQDATRFIRINSEPRVFYVDGGKKHPLGSADAFKARGGTSWDMVLSVSPSTANSLADGSILN